MNRAAPRSFLAPRLAPLLGCAVLLLVGVAPSIAAPPAAAPARPTPVAAGALHWRMIGPYRGGRTKAVTGIPGRPHSLLIGAVNGGVWRTDDDGRTWQPIFDAAPTQSVGAIVVAPSNPSIIYVGSGEGLQRPDLSVGDGIYRSQDAGATWQHLALDDARQIPELAVDPRDANRLYAAVLGHPFGPNEQRGIFKSVDGGLHWSRVLYVDANTGGSSIKIDPENPDVLYAGLWNVRAGPWEDKNVYNGTAGGLFKSMDGGDHWRRLTAGLPDTLSQIDIAVAPSQPGRLYATVATTEEGDYSSSAGLGVYRSDDGGEHWARATTDPRPALRIGGGDLPIIKVDPSNADVLYSASLVTMKSVDGGVHWSSLRGAPGGDDYQNLWVSPDEPGRIGLVSDQGAIVTVDGGRTWSSWFNQPTAQLYHIGVTPTYPYRVCSGQQESGSVCIASRGNDGEITFRDWHPVGVIEYGYVVPDPLDPNIVYGAGRNVVTRTHLPTGQVQDISPIPLRGEGVRADRTEPLFFAPQDPHRMYYAANRLYETVDAGRSWRAISPDLSREDPGTPASVGDLHVPGAEKQRGVIYAASPSALENGLVWAGTDDGSLWVTHDDGTQWQNVTPPVLTPWSKVTQLEASHFDAATAYASVSRFRVDDLAPYVYRTRDGGRTWQLIVTGLPAIGAVNAVREDPVRRGLLYAATENAVWMSIDDGDHWDSLQLNLPHTSMRDLAIHDQDLIVATHGRGFWILDDVSPLRQFPAGTPAGDALLLAPATAVRVARDTNTDTPIPPDEPTGRNPPQGAVIDYYLGTPHAKSPVVTLDILDAAGKAVRHVASTAAPEFTADELERELIPLYWLRPAQPPSAAPGMHRWVWDLRYETPRTAQRGFPIAAVPGDTPSEPEGPLAVPGRYKVRLTIDGHHWEQPLTVVPDPRLPADTDALAAQLALEQPLAAALDQSTVALLTIRSLRAQLKDRNAGPAVPAAAALDKSLAALLDGGAPQPGAEPEPGVERVNGNLAALYAQINGVDAAPTATQTAAVDKTLRQWPPLEQRSATLFGADLTAVNAALRQAHLAPLEPALAPPRDPDMADEE